MIEVRRATVDDAEALGVIGPAAYAAAYHYLWSDCVALGSVRKVLWERRCGDPTCPAMECEALLYPISNGVKEAANSGFAAALRLIAGQARSHNDTTMNDHTFRTEPNMQRISIT